MGPEVRRVDYYDLHRSLKAAVGREEDRLAFDDRITIWSLPFCSRSEGILPGETRYACPVHGRAFEEVPEPDASAPVLPGLSGVHDSRIPENRRFHYEVFTASGADRAREVILLFHGFNEKRWDKYLPWAYSLATSTGKAVVLFPIAFHMNRAPAAWSDRHLMHRASRERNRQFPSIVASTLSNAAISIRLQSRPQRFIWSGLQTYYDVLQLVEQIAAGAHPLIAPGASIDLFGYSIGCLLAQILLMTDPGRLFARTRLFMFCGGAVFNRTSPVSRFILDSECNVALYSYLVEHLESHVRVHERLHHFLCEDHPEGVNFRAMLNAGVNRREREAQFGRIGRRLMGVALESDTVIAPGEVMNTLQGPLRTLPPRVEVLDFDYAYSHEDPFPASESLRVPVDRAFSRVMTLAASFYGDGGK
jgi:hypothetical protein